MKRARCWYVVALVLAGVSSPAAPSWADDAAEELFNRGVEEMKAGRYAAACPAIAESHRRDPRPGTLFTLATCEDGWGHPATAATLYGDYLALYETLPEDRKAAQRESGRPRIAGERRDKLAPDVAELTLTLPPGAPAGTVVKRDGQVMVEPRAALRVDPGEHVVSTTAPGGPVWEQTVTLAKGEKKTVVLEVRPAPTLEPAPVVAPPEPIPPEAGPSGRRVASYVIGGAARRDPPQGSSRSGRRAPIPTAHPIEYRALISQRGLNESSPPGPR